MAEESVAVDLAVEELVVVVFDSYGLPVFCAK